MQLCREKLPNTSGPETVAPRAVLPPRHPIGGYGEGNEGNEGLA